IERQGNGEDESSFGGERASNRGKKRLRPRTAVEHVEACDHVVVRLGRAGFGHVGLVTAETAAPQSFRHCPACLGRARFPAARSQSKVSPRFGRGAESRAMAAPLYRVPAPRSGLEWTAHGESKPSPYMFTRSAIPLGAIELLGRGPCPRGSLRDRSPAAFGEL